MSNGIFFSQYIYEIKSCDPHRMKASWDGESKRSWRQDFFLAGESLPSLQFMLIYVVKAHSGELADKAMFWKYQRELWLIIYPKRIAVTEK